MSTVPVAWSTDGCLFVILNVKRIIVMALEHQNTTYETAENLEQSEKSKPSEKLGQTRENTGG